MPSDLPSAEQLETWTRRLEACGHVRFRESLGETPYPDQATREAASAEANVNIAEVNAFLRSDRLKAALATLEAVEWIEARADVLATRSWSPSKGANWLVVHNAKRATSGYHDGLLEAVAALKARIEKES